MDVTLAYLSVSLVLGSAIRFLSRSRETSPRLSPRVLSTRALSPRHLLPLPDFISNMDAESSSASSSSGSAPQQKNPHLALFQSMGRMLRHDPTAVIARLSAWLSDGSSPHFWAPFALSIRGFAYEVMDEGELARMDYVEGLRLYDALAKEIGKEPVRRMESNVNFMRIRIRTLPPPKPAAVRRREPDYVVIEYGYDGAMI